MTYEQAYQRLLNHGNAVSSGGGDMPDEESFLFAVRKAEKDKSPPALKQLYDDILSCLEAVNRHLNGDRPSEGAAGENSQLDQSLVYSMWSILHGGWEYHRRWELHGPFERPVRDELALTLWRISCAWGAVFDGDIDSLAGHVRDEEIARR
ncbi:MAG TPA: hypothetical protein VGX48_07175 [Pyrinomonadaceae bacterium]|jgi:hypothetical protein|nr:hypothetical protein [Pyrinomonadaceae bacterium]